MVNEIDIPGNQLPEVLTESELLELPPVVAGHESPVVRKKLESFYMSVAHMFEAWVKRSENYHTQRCYRRDVLSFIEFLNIDWPVDSWQLLKTSVEDVRRWRSFMSDEKDFAPKTLNRRISSLSGFFQFMREVAADAKLPIIVQNPAHKDFIKRPATDPVEETKPLTANQARKLMGYPAGDEILDFRDRAILKFYLFTGARIATGCNLDVADFRFDEDDSTIRIEEKGRSKSKRTIGIHPEAAEAIHEYIEKAGIVSGPLFRARLNSRSEKLGKKRIGLTAMYELLLRYLEKLPRSHKTIELPDGTTVKRCIFTPHSLRATTATMLLKSGVDIIDVQTLLGHRHVTTTQIYDKRVRQTTDSASHKVPF
jgi:site-specific recombinase XerD